MSAPYFQAVVGAVWVSVTPADLTERVQVETRYTSAAGSVQPAEWRRAKPVDACPIFGDGHVIGYSLGCKQDRRAADGLQY